jgi:hypothetical protein
VWAIAFASPFVFMLVVVVLGLITPGYNHFFHTISELVVRKYGLFQQLNFLQLSGGFLISAFLFSKQVASAQARKTLVWMSILCAFFLLVVVAFPTDPRNLGEMTSVTASGDIHFAALGTFFLSTPFGIFTLQKALKTDASLKRFSSITTFAGISLSVLAYIWTFLYLNHIWLTYLGLAQKAMVIAALVWFLELLWAIRPKSLINSTT